MYSEAISAESLDDLIHKLSMALKELRESKMTIDILWDISQNPNLKHELHSLSEETNELISIFFASIKTCKEKKRLKTTQKDKNK